eukprot:m.256176 g.256176  ORF g.256176 m.256176 type:complete len:143 (-) comp34152_c0_seq1:311-739(-)
MSAFEAKLGATLKGKNGDVSTKDALGDCDLVGFYFSAHWCPPCRGFTPVLADTYNKLKASGKKFEIVFISSDQDESAFNSYHGEQPWLALPFADRATKDKLSKEFGVRGIPTFVLLNKDGSVKTTEGRGVISNDTSGEKFPW